MVVAVFSRGAVLCVCVVRVWSSYCDSVMWICPSLRGVLVDVPVSVCDCGVVCLCVFCTLCLCCYVCCLLVCLLVLYVLLL